VSRGGMSRRGLLTAAGLAGGLAVTGRGGLAQAAERNAGRAMPAADAQLAAGLVTNPADYVNPMIGTGVGGPVVGAVDMSPAPSHRSA